MSEVIKQNYSKCLFSSPPPHLHKDYWNFPQYHHNSSFLSHQIIKKAVSFMVKLWWLSNPFSPSNSCNMHKFRKTVPWCKPCLLYVPVLPLFLQFHAMDVLHQQGYDLAKAMSILVPSGGPVICRDQLEEWSASEANLFEEALEKYGKDFNDIRQDFVSILLTL